MMSTQQQNGLVESLSHLQQSQQLQQHLMSQQSPAAAAAPAATSGSHRNSVGLPQHQHYHNQFHGNSPSPTASTKLLSPR